MKPSASLLLAMLGAGALQAAAAATPRLDVALSPRQVTVGDPVTLTLTVHLAPGGNADGVRFPDWSHGWGEAQTLDASKPESRSSAAGVDVVQVVRLAAYRTGTIGLPPLEIGIGGDPLHSLKTPNDLHFEIRSVLPQSAQPPQPKMPAEPRRLAIPAAFWWTSGAFAVALVAALWLLRRRRAVAAAARITQPPLAELEAELARLADGEPVAGHVALSLALRRFLGRSFSMPAAESTTSELGRRLDRGGLDGDLVRRIVRLLREVDPVKFARQPASREQLGERVSTARGVAVDVDRQLHPPQQESAA